MTSRFDWHNDFKQRVREFDHAERLKTEPVVIREGDYLNGLYLVRAGFVRVSRKYNNTEKTIAYLGKGQSFGLKELLYNAQHETPIGTKHTLRALGYVDLLLIPSHLVEDYIIPALTEEEKREFAEGVGQEEHEELISHDDMPSEISPQLVEFFLDQRTINGTATMLINLDRCTRCDDCVRACASTHDNNPRFVRHGPVADGVQVTNACMHCIDPVCMLECPTGAIHRDQVDGQILINDYTCIGCSMCANSCPYDNIQMVPITDEEGRPQYPVQLDAEGNIRVQKTWEEPFRKATKCDLCTGQRGGPACVRACPHDALIRSDMRDLPALAKWLNR